MAIRVDPSMTGMLSRSFARQIHLRLADVVRALRTKLVAEDALGLESPTPLFANAERRAWEFQSDDEKLGSFAAWVKSLLDNGLLGDINSPAAVWAAKFTDAAHQRGLIRAYRDVDKTKLKSPDWLGGKLSEFIRRMKSDPTIAPRLKVLASRAFQELRGLSSEASTKLNRILANGLLQGRTPRQMAAEMAKQISDLSERRALSIARTEMVHAQAEGQLDAFEALGIEKVGLYAEWVTAGDDKVCPKCEPLEGVQFTIAEARGLLPRHPNCVVGESMIECPDPLTVSKASFTGRVVEIVTGKGRRLTVTENHILLSEAGWVQAKDVREGDRLLDASSFYGGHSPAPLRSEAISCPNHDQAVPQIQEVFRALVEAFGKLGIVDSIAPCAEYFHGDGRSLDEKIDIVNLYRLLGYESETGFPSQLKELPFQLRARFLRAGMTFDHQCALTEILKRAAAAADCFMGRLSVSPVLLRGALGHAEAVGLCGGSESNAMLLQHTLNQASSVPEASGDWLSVFTREIAANDLSSGVCVEFDVARVVSIYHVSNLPVYDVSTMSSLYMLNGLVSSNCRCAWVPSVEYARHNRTRDRDRAVAASLAAESRRGSKRERVRRARISSPWGGKRFRSR